VFGGIGTNIYVAGFEVTTEGLGDLGSELHLDDVDPRNNADQRNDKDEVIDNHLPMRDPPLSFFRLWKTFGIPNKFRTPWRTHGWRAKAFSISPSHYV
jgi:hypothetical protein